MFCLIFQQMLPLSELAISIASNYFRFLYQRQPARRPEYLKTYTILRRTIRFPFHSARLNIQQNDAYMSDLYTAQVFPSSLSLSLIQVSDANEQSLCLSVSCSVSSQMSWAFVTVTSEETDISYPNRISYLSYPSTSTALYCKFSLGWSRWS